MHAQQDGSAAEWYPTPAASGDATCKARGPPTLAETLALPNWDLETS